MSEKLAKGRKKPDLGPHPPLHELPWMRVEIKGESGNWFVFALAIYDGQVVGGAPIARRMVGMSARAAWQMYRARGAKLMRLDP